ncbi:Plastocyanin [Halovenus aranensis]|uniref:Plastocyanin n=1 Tax=Halovenus aranensis TaxID=890420 RepID=A0A1G8SKD6_9EURY|nr:DUF5059 domain-containing protein [Halovenus aranensis]SDJ29634.1 Plastocyanin [Halovenus aranensis]
MQQTRRRWLQSAGAVLTSVALAGCSGSDSDEPEETEGGKQTGDTPDSNATEDGSGEDGSDGGEFAAVDVAVAAEWNAIRTRLRDPVILGHAEEYAAGAGVVGDIFERFETASGEYNAHEMLEETSTEHYEGFEAGLNDLRETLEAEDLEGAHEAMHAADKHLRKAQAALTDNATVKRLSMLVMGAHVEDAAMLLEVGDYDDATHEFSNIGGKFEEKHYDMVAEADSEAADGFLDAIDRAEANAESDTEAAIAAAHEAFGAATQGMHALASDSVAGAAHMAALQARGWDGMALANLGGVSQSYAHAAALNDYRAQAQDAMWLFEHGNAEAAAAFVQRAFEQFETARAHDALEDADHDSYESFERGLEQLGEAIENDNAEAVAEATVTVEDAVRSGIEALASGHGPALLEAGYMKTRIEDAHERYLLGESERAGEIAQSVFADFEADAGGFHETLEETDESLYDAFEHEHLEGLIEAFEAGDDEAVTDHVEGIRETLLSFETALASRPAVSGVESGYITARLRDSVVLERLDATERAQTVSTDAFGYFEAGAGGFHEAIEEADHETYESFEGAVEALQNSLEDDGTTDAVESVTAYATDATYAVVAAGTGGAGAAPFVSDVFAHFEGAAVHELLEDADHETYEAFEGALETYIDALESGESPREAATVYADGSLKAQFAVAGAVEDAPVDADGGGDGSDGDGATSELEGGPNVVEGVPDDADHVVDMTAVAFEPEELTVSTGDTVAWSFAGGEPHSVTAYEEKIPAEADYWASGGFDSESAAREGWESGKGAVQDGESYVRTFETPGTHEYLCIPHEAAGMVGSVIVEE